MLHRRDVLIGLGAAALHPRLWSQSNTREASISVDWKSEGHKIPSDYSGVSYESTQLVNPAFFSPHHRQLIAIYPDPLYIRTENPWNKGVLLTGPEFESKEGITLRPMHMGKTSTLDLPAHSAGVVWKR